MMNINQILRVVQEGIDVIQFAFEKRYFNYRLENFRIALINITCDACNFSNGKYIQMK